MQSKKLKVMNERILEFTTKVQDIRINLVMKHIYPWNLLGSDFTDTCKNLQCV